MRELRVSKYKTVVEPANLIRYSPIRRDDSCDERYEGKQRKHRGGAS